MDLNRPFETRRADITRINTHGVKLHRFTVETLIQGVGEVLVTIPFPVFYVEIPGFSFGYVFDDNVEAVLGNYPTTSATIIRWDRVQKQGENVGWFYKGATIAVVLTGETDQRGYLHSHFEGKALRNPLQADLGGGL